MFRGAEELAGQARGIKPHVTWVRSYLGRLAETRH
jgi:hypothetical protein